MQAKPLRIGSYNMENYFAADTSDLSAGAKPAAAVTALRHTLNELDCDILAVQEIDSQATLQELNAMLDRPYAYCHVEPGNYYRGLHLGFLSRYPLTVTSNRDTLLFAHDGQPLYDHTHPEHVATAELDRLHFQRDLLQADVTIGGQAGLLTLFNLHLKSQGPSDWRLLDQQTIRYAECRAAAELINEFGIDSPATSVIVLGDLNAIFDDDSIAALVVDLGLADVLQSDWVEAGHKPVYSFHKFPNRRRLDYLLLNTPASEHLVPASARIHRSKYSRRASDHFPVSLALDLKANPQ